MKLVRLDKLAQFDWFANQIGVRCQLLDDPKNLPVHRPTRSDRHLLLRIMNPTCRAVGAKGMPHEHDIAVPRNILVNPEVTPQPQPSE